jgi:hypothetical protein
MVLPSGKNTWYDTGACSGIAVPVLAIGGAMTAPLWVSQALNAHAATIKIDILPNMIPLHVCGRLPRPRNKCGIRTVRFRTLGNCHCSQTAALIFVMAETRETVSASS